MMQSATRDLDYRLNILRVRNGAANVIRLDHNYGDGMNLTAVTDAVTPANTVTMSYHPSNRLASATANGLWGAATYTYDAVGNRAISALTLASYSTGTIRADRNQKSFKLPPNAFKTKRGTAGIIARGAWRPEIWNRARGFLLRFRHQGYEMANGNRRAGSTALAAHCLVSRGTALETHPDLIVHSGNYRSSGKCVGATGI
jgi:hypothetical protein